MKVKNNKILNWLQRDTDSTCTYSAVNKIFFFLSVRNSTRFPVNKEIQLKYSIKYQIQFKKILQISKRTNKYRKYYRSFSQAILTGFLLTISHITRTGNYSFT